MENIRIQIDSRNRHGLYTRDGVDTRTTGNYQCHVTDHSTMQAAELKQLSPVDIRLSCEVFSPEQPLVPTKLVFKSETLLIECLHTKLYPIQRHIGIRS